MFNVISCLHTPYHPLTFTPTTIHTSTFHTLNIPCTQRFFFNSLAGVLDLLLDKHETATAPRLKRLIYVSCGFEALERDTQALIDKDQWRIKSTEG